MILKRGWTFYLNSARSALDGLKLMQKALKSSWKEIPFLNLFTNSIILKPESRRIGITLRAFASDSMMIDRAPD